MADTRQEWDDYVRAMRAHRSSDERLWDRITAYVGDPPRMPVNLTDSDARAWRGLVREMEERAASHGEHLDALLESLRADGGR